MASAQLGEKGQVPHEPYVATISLLLPLPTASSPAKEPHACLACPEFSDICVSS